MIVPVAFVELVVNCAWKPVIKTFLFIHSRPNYFLLFLFLPSVITPSLSSIIQFILPFSPNFFFLFSISLLFFTFFFFLLSFFRYWRWTIFSPKKMRNEKNDVIADNFWKPNSPTFLSLFLSQVDFTLNTLDSLNIHETGWCDYNELLHKKWLCIHRSASLLQFNGFQAGEGRKEKRRKERKEKGRKK